MVLTDRGKQRRFVRRDAYDRLGGFDERFDFPGGGFVNLDFFRRTVLRKGSELVMLLGEGTFHQLHGGIATNARSEQERQDLQRRWETQYKALRGAGPSICLRNAPSIWAGYRPACCPPSPHPYSLPWKNPRFDRGFKL